MIAPELIETCAVVTVIANGTAGFVSLGRAFWREQGAKDYIVDGNTKTCLVDAAIVAIRNEGFEVDKDKVYSQLVTDADELDIATVVVYVREEVWLIA